MEDDQGERADQSTGYRVRVDEQKDSRSNPERPEHDARPANSFAEVRGPEHREPEADEADRREQESRDEQSVEYPVCCLPDQDECRLIRRGRTRGMIEVRNRTGGDMHQRSGREQNETENTQDAPEVGRREARPPESTVQREEVRDPQDEDKQIEAILYRADHADIRVSDDEPLWFSRVRSHEQAHDDEYGKEDNATQDSGQAAPAENAVLLIHCFHTFPPHLH